MNSNSPDLSDFNRAPDDVDHPADIFGTFKNANSLLATPQELRRIIDQATDKQGPLTLPDSIRADFPTRLLYHFNDNKNASNAGEHADLLTASIEARLLRLDIVTFYDAVANMCVDGRLDATKEKALSDYAEKIVSQKTIMADQKACIFLSKVDDLDNYDEALGERRPTTALAKDMLRVAAVKLNKLAPQP